MLRVRDLHVSFGPVAAVRGLDLDVGPGEIVGLVGESGSGKSATALSLLRLLPAEVRAAAIEVAGRDVHALSERELRGVRGRLVGTLFQEPMTSLNPVLRVGEQVAEPARIHLGLDRPAGRGLAARLLAQVGLEERHLDAFPHQLSGGQRQRVLLATALACDPGLIVADEPTTALDVLTQAQILALVRGLGRSMLWITHDLAVVRQIADRVAVMYAGVVQEAGRTADVLRDPIHPYTQGLVASRRDHVPVPAGPILDRGCRFAPRCPIAVARCHAVEPPLAPIGEREVRCHLVGTPAARGLWPAVARAPVPPAGEPVVTVRALSVAYPVQRGLLRRRVGAAPVLSGISLDVRRGEVLAVVGASGSGKTTLGRAIAGLLRFAAPEVEISGTVATKARVQTVFQDPYGSLDPRWTVRATIGADAERWAARVGLDAALLDRYPHALSGGQRQRVGIARALAQRPEVLIADEPLSALDASLQAEILALLLGLRAELGLTIVLIAHDLAVVRAVADRIAVLAEGRVVELGAPDAIGAHPYTRALWSAAALDGGQPPADVTPP